MQRGQPDESRNQPVLRAAYGSPTHSGIGLVGAAVLLCVLAAAKACCGFAVFGSLLTVRDRSAFVGARTASGKPLRWCICRKDFDPLGRRTGKIGAMTTDTLCQACYTGGDLAAFRDRLVNGGVWLPWVLWALSVPLPLMAFARLPALRSCGTMVWARLAAAATALDLLLCVLMIFVGMDWNVFKSLCLSGHTFDEQARVEVPFKDELYFDVCGYSADEEQMTAAMVVVVVLDLFIFAVLSYLTSLLQDPAATRSAAAAANSAARAAEIHSELAIAASMDGPPRPALLGSSSQGAAAPTRPRRQRRRRARPSGQGAQEERGMGHVELGMAGERARSASGGLRHSGRHDCDSQGDGAGLDDIFLQTSRSGAARARSASTSVLSATISRLADIAERKQNTSTPSYAVTVSSASSSRISMDAGGNPKFFSYALRQSGGRRLRGRSGTIPSGRSPSWESSSITSVSDSMTDLDESELRELFHDPPSRT